MTPYKILVATVTIIALAACSRQDVPDLNSKNPTTGRWYTAEQVKQGNALYDANCISCHHPRGSGTPDWRKPLADGSYPPPPLNGTAHTWHHSLQVLLNTLEEGGIPMGGKMPAFGKTLDDEQKLAVIAYLQSQWRDEIYSQWLQRQPPQ